MWYNINDLITIWCQQPSQILICKEYPRIKLSPRDTIRYSPVASHLFVFGIELLFTIVRILFFVTIVSILVVSNSWQRNDQLQMPYQQQSNQPTLQRNWKLSRRRSNNRQHKSEQLLRRVDGVLILDHQGQQRVPQQRQRLLVRCVPSPISPKLGWPVSLPHGQWRVQYCVNKRQAVSLEGLWWDTNWIQAGRAG